MGWLVVAGAGTLQAQDPQFSQFYAAPLYLNPAFAGSAQQGRMGLNYRNQWPGVDANFTTVSAFADFFIEDKNSGVGFMLNRDHVPLVGLQSISLAVQYAYQLRLTRTLSFRPGFQAAVYQRSINFNRLTFGNQFDPNTGEFLGGDPGEGLSGGMRFFPDISAGGLFYSPNAWLGVAAHHLTQPNNSLLGEDSNLPRKLSVHAGWKFFMRPGVMGQGVYARRAERSIAPVMQYRRQGPFTQMDVGTYFTFEPIVIGTWYRGIPFRTVNNIINHEAIVLLVGMTIKGAKDVLNIGYSYDITISRLGPGSGGSHELSLVYSWPTRNPRKPPKDKLIIPCPDF
jgi:type IX secretion system PorP/SprF family membrane protein